MQKKNLTFCSQKKPVIEEMVIAIAYANIESHTAIEFTQILFYIRTVLDYEIDYIQITVPYSCVIAIIESQ